MLKRAAALVALAIVLLAGCGDSGGGGGGEGGNELSRRLRSVLTESPELVDGLAVEDATCPNITTPRAGDRATCIVHLDGVAPPVEVDIEFAEDGSFVVVNVER